MTFCISLEFLVLYCIHPVISIAFILLLHSSCDAVETFSCNVLCHLILLLHSSCGAVETFSCNVLCHRVVLQRVGSVSAVEELLGFGSLVSSHVPSAEQLQVEGGSTGRC